ncbi:MAG: hypothetical protein AB1631_08825 [Acidobacteriota bacterium]
MSKRARQTKKTTGPAGFLAACLLALAMAVGFNWALFGDWNTPFPSRIRLHIRHTDTDDSREQISKPLDANVRRRALGKFF